MRQLNNEQARAVRHFEGPMLVLAGPGSGKTFTLVERIRYLIEARGVDPGCILTITFSKKASIEMKTRFYELVGDKNYPVTFGTFHSIFYNILKTYHNYTLDSILTPNEKIKYMKRILRKLSIEATGSDDFAVEMLSKISAYKSVAGINDEPVCDTYKEYPFNPENKADASTDRFLYENFENELKQKEFLQIYGAYEKECRADGKLDFDDMITLCLQLLKENKAALEKWQGIFKYFLVDEFQDINDVQYEILMLLAGDGKNIFAVGDDDQSIYGFRGSKPSLMKRFLEIQGCQIVDMYKNYRCAEDVIAAAGCLIAENKERIVKNQISCKDDKDGTVYTGTFASEKEEADFVVNKLLKLSDAGGKIESTAILYRTERCVAFLAEKLKLAGISFVKTVKSGSFYDESWVKDVISYLKIAAGRHDTEDIYRIINKPDRGISREEVRASLHNYSHQQYQQSSQETSPDIGLHNLLQSIRFIRPLTPYAAITYIFKSLDYYKYLLKESFKQKKDRSAADEMFDALLDRSKSFTNIPEWLDFIEYTQGEENENTDNTEANENKGNAVVLQTAHSSKGLEYENVFIIGLTEGLFPHHKAKTGSEIEEERRLMYVAMTRAKKNLYVLGRGEANHGKRESRFVSEVKNCGKTVDIVL